LLALFVARLDTQAVHTDGLVEMDGNVASTVATGWMAARVPVRTFYCAIPGPC
jgi:hypothetical protein